MPRKQLASDHPFRVSGSPNDIHYFPRLLPDEHLCSVVARFVRHSGFTAFAAREMLFGNPGYTMRLDAPTNIGRFCSNFMDEKLSEPMAVIADLTPFHYVTAYMQQTKREEIAAYMRSPPTERHGVLPSVGRWKVKKGEGLRFCGACHAADRADRHLQEPYWRRLHQLQGVAVCVKHGDVLQISKVRLGYDTNGADALPSAMTCPDSAPTVAVVDKCGLDLLRRLAERAQELLANSRRPETVADIVDRYRARAASLGLNGTRGITPENAAMSFASVWGPALPAMPYLLAADGLPSRWLQRMFTKEQDHYPMHPLPHLLVEIWLDRATKLDQSDEKLIALKAARVGTFGVGRVAGWRSKSADMNRAFEVPKAAADIRAKLPEKRVTRNEIARVLGLAAVTSSEIAARHWPLTSAAIDRAVETSDAFFKRRLFRQMDIMVSEGKDAAVLPALERIGRRRNIAYDDGLLAEYHNARQSVSSC